MANISGLLRVNSLLDLIKINFNLIFTTILQVQTCYCSIKSDNLYLHMFKAPRIQIYYLIKENVMLQEINLQFKANSNKQVPIQQETKEITILGKLLKEKLMDIGNQFHMTKFQPKMLNQSINQVPYVKDHTSKIYFPDLTLS